MSRGRQRFKCTGCGVEVEGREQPDGRVLAYDRAGYDGTPVCPAVCFSCIPPINISAIDNATKGGA